MVSGNIKILVTKSYNVTNKETLKKLNSGKSKGNVAVTLKSKPGYYYRIDNAGNYIKFKGDPKNHSSKKTPVSKITKKSNPEAWNYLTKSGKTELVIIYSFKEEVL
jgi:hypothetical protein